jgi:hypothetical protein
VSSALEQTVADIEVVIIGDGATDAVRAAAEALVAVDGRVVFHDFPKGPYHGEIHRGTAIERARSDAIFYLCDDDLLLPRHVANLLELLADADLVQCRNGYVDTEGRLQLFPTDLALPEAVAWHVREPPRNATSLTGTAHTRSAYRALPEGWTTTPKGQWPDHYMWKKFFGVEGFCGATHAEMTAIQLPTSSGREDWAQEERVEELQIWRERLREPGAHEWLQHEVAEATQRRLVLEHIGSVDCHFMRAADLAELSLLREAVVGTEGALREMERGAAAADERVAELTAELLWAGMSRQDILDSRSWRLTGPMRRGAESLRRWRGMSRPS